MRTLFLLFVTMLSTVALNQPVPKPTILKIGVSSSGTVFLNGKVTTMKSLEAALKTAKAHNGQVWYYRDASRSDPPQHAMEVLKLVIDNKLPVSLSTKPDFSDYVDEHGQSHPREAK
jgi:hypothetical protein